MHHELLCSCCHDDERYIANDDVTVDSYRLDIYLLVVAIRSIDHINAVIRGVVVVVVVVQGEGTVGVHFTFDSQIRDGFEHVDRRRRFCFGKEGKINYVTGGKESKAALS